MSVGLLVGGCECRVVYDKSKYTNFELNGASEGK